MILSRSITNMRWFSLSVNRVFHSLSDHTEIQQTRKPPSLLDRPNKKMPVFKSKVVGIDKTKTPTETIMHRSRNKGTSNSRLVNKALSAGSLHTEAALAPGFLIVPVIRDIGGFGTSEQAPVDLLRRAGLLNKLGTIAEEAWSGRGHANSVEVCKVVPRRSREFVIIVE